MFFFSFFFNDTATTEIYTLSLHDALPLCSPQIYPPGLVNTDTGNGRPSTDAFTPHTPSASARRIDRKSTRLNSSHSSISYAVFCLKKKKKKLQNKVNQELHTTSYTNT